MIIGLDIRLEYHKGYGPPRLRIKKMDKPGQRTPEGTLVRCLECGDGFLVKTDEPHPRTHPLRVV